MLQGEGVTDEGDSADVAGSGDFRLHFKLLTGHEPFPWQRALFSELLAGQFPKSCDIPTGLGKTSVIAVWLLALVHRAQAASEAGFPRRLIYVVNRRTVVDQATREVERMRHSLTTEVDLRTVAEALISLAALPSGTPLAISTLRGQFADNAEWRGDPARAAVIVGTVDMIGSRLLFGGYGCGFKSRPLHAGFLGQHALLVHDEAHLEPAFQDLIAAVEAEQDQCHEFADFRVMALTATSRAGDGTICSLSAADRAHEVVRSRLEAKKGIAFIPVDNDNEIPNEITRRALEYRDSGQAILVFARKLRHVEAIDRRLCGDGLAVQRLTGTLRGLERDELANKDPVFARFVQEPSVTPRDGTVYLVCTSAGEVGVNISANHLIADLTPFDSMAQRFGRVNRFGDGNARIDVVYHLDAKANTTVGRDESESDDRQGDVRSDSPHSMNDDERPGAKRSGEGLFSQACERTLRLLQQLPRRADGRYDASPGALDDLPAIERQAAFTPPPVIPPVNDILFDVWALTSVRGSFPGRPAVADWLHGIAEWEPPETYVAWREEVELLTPELRETHAPEDVLEDYPLKPHELLRDSTDRVFYHLERIAERGPEFRVWVIEPGGGVSVLVLSELIQKNQQKKPAVNLAACTVLLPPAAGGLRFDDAGSPTGIIDGDVGFDETRRALYDVADKWVDVNGQPQRCRVWDADDAPAGMRPVRTIDISPTGDDEEEGHDEPSGRRYWCWFVRPRSADDDGSRTARKAQDLQPHLDSAERFANALVSKLGLREPQASAVRLAARWHDLGKRRRVWQRSIGNHAYPGRELAKSAGTIRPRELTGYRHELGSLIDVSGLDELGRLTPEVQDLVFHLIAAHHGRARPHFTADEAFDPERTDEAVAKVVREVPRRFARLQRKYGRWGLAYLESLVRSADALASQNYDAHASNVIDLTDRPVLEAAQ